MENIYTKDQLRTYQALPLDVKVGMTINRIREWHRHFGGAVCVSFSGGKDSTVLLHLVRQYDPSVKALFVNTGLEYPEIQSFVRSKDNVEIVRPEMRFDEVISKYGYPLISKEVAEAIYYARRIRSQTVQVERERERQRKTTYHKRKEICGNREKPNATKFVGWHADLGSVGTTTNREREDGTNSRDSEPG